MDFLRGIFGLPPGAEAAAKMQEEATRSFFDACETGKSNALPELLAEVDGPRCLQETTLQSGLEKACERGNADVVEQLLALDGSRKLSILRAFRACKSMGRFFALHERLLGKHSVLCIRKRLRVGRTAMHANREAIFSHRVAGDIERVATLLLGDEQRRQEIPVEEIHGETLLQARVWQDVRMLRVLLTLPGPLAVPPWRRAEEFVETFRLGQKEYSALALLQHPAGAIYDAFGFIENVLWDAARQWDEYKFGYSDVTAALRKDLADTDGNEQQYRMFREVQQDALCCALELFIRRTPALDADLFDMPGEPQKRLSSKTAACLLAVAFCCSFPDTLHGRTRDVLAAGCVRKIPRLPAGEGRHASRSPSDDACCLPCCCVAALHSIKWSGMQSSTSQRLFTKQGRRRLLLFRHQQQAAKRRAELT